MRYISNNSIRRLPRYLRRLDEMAARGVCRTSSMELAEYLGLTPSLTRHDFSCFGEFGLQGYGYNVDSLREDIRRVLGCDRVYTIVLVGVGNLGHALLENINQFPSTLLFLGAFDICPELIGKNVSGETVMAGECMENFIHEHVVDIAIITVPRSEAQKVADAVITAGIRAIWNFTDVELDTKGADVLVENIHFSDSFYMLSYRLSQTEHKSEISLTSEQNLDNAANQIIRL